MSEELQLDINLERDFLLKNSDDEDIKFNLELKPNSDFFSYDNSIQSHIILLLDSSSSMETSINKYNKYTKKDAVIDAAKGLIDNGLKPGDLVSVITYNSQAVILNRGKEVSDNKDEIKSSINTIKDHTGGTNFEKAMIAAENVSDNNNCHIIFLTDGQSTRGDDNEALRISEKLAEEGVTINALGIDNNSFNFMRSLTEPSNGYTESIKENKREEIVNKVNQSFQEFSSKASNSVIRNVFMDLKIPAGYRDLEIYQITPEMRNYQSKINEMNDGKRVISINCGNLVLGHKNSYVLAMYVDTSSDDNILLSEVRISYSLPSQNRNNIIENRSVHLNLTDDESQSKYNNFVTELYQEAQFLKMYEDVKNCKDQDDIDGAIKRLQAMINKAEKLGKINIAEKYKKSLDKIKENNNITTEELNAISETITVSQEYGRGRVLVEDSNVEDDAIGGV